MFFSHMCVIGGGEEGSYAFCNPFIYDFYDSPAISQMRKVSVCPDQLATSHDDYAIGK